jgi:NTP pyrophosphatase (non-canonical NTP hydrolase)
MNTMELTLRECQRLIDDWIATYGVRYYSELTNLGILMEEVGELARIMCRTYGEQSFKDSDRDYHLADELADILFVVMCIANQTGTDLTEAVQKNLVKKTQRDHARHRQNQKLQRDTLDQKGT